MRLLIAPFLLLSACAPAASVVTPADHPATASGASEASVRLATLAPVAQPDLPAPLRPDGRVAGHAVAPMDHAAMDHAAMDHAAMGHGAATPAGADHSAMDHSAMDHSAMDHRAMGHAAPESAAADHRAMDHATMDHGSEGVEADPFAVSLDAYLAVQEALAADQTTGVAEQARAFSGAFDALTASAPADDPHRWHMRAAELAAIRTAASDLAEAATLADAREAFARLSAPYLRVAQVVGLPAEAGLRAMTCGMVAGAPEGGVWLQRPGPTRNPYFGSAMASCGSEHDAPAGAAGHEGH
jgi:hypothetical protein